MKKSQDQNSSVKKARSKWLKADEKVSQFEKSLFQEGSGYGDSEARRQDEHRLQSSREEARRSFQVYNDLARQDLELKMLHLQRSQQKATWASFTVAVAVGLATIVNILITLFK